jgi:hypothetical protein
MTRSFRSIVLIMQYMFHCLPIYELHISLLEVGWERRHNVTMLLKIPHILRGENRHTP